MTVKALYEYKFEPKDKANKFHGMQLLYLCWSNHLLFCAPFAFLVAPDITFSEFIETILTPAIAAHPDAEVADFSGAEWLLNDKVFVPELSASLKDNGIDHKSMLTVKTQGLNGIAGSAS